MVKNTLDVCLGGITFWLFGFGFAFGPNDNETLNKFTGNGFWALEVDTATEASTYTQMFFHLSFSTAATTIVSGKLIMYRKLFVYMCNTNVVSYFTVICSVQPSSAVAFLFKL